MSDELVYTVHTPIDPVHNVHNRVVSSVDLFQRVRYQLDQADTSLWGAHIKSAAVTYIVGETSVGKTVFLHNLAYHLAKGEEFLGTTPCRPLKVLYIDFESNDEILAEHLSLIGTVDGWDFFNLSGITPGDAFIRELQPIVAAGRYDVVIIDPLMEAIPVNDENDNASANRQMLVFRELARNTKAGVVVVHNSGHKKGDFGNKKFLGRGATARQDRADVGINVTIVGDDVRQFEVVKSRSSNLGDKVTFRFAGELGYEVIENTAPPSAAIDKLCETILSYMGECGKPVLAADLQTRYGGARGTAQAMLLRRTLTRLVTLGKLSRPQRGQYGLAGSQPVIAEGSCEPSLPVEEPPCDRSPSPALYSPVPWTCQLFQEYA